MKHEVTQKQVYCMPQLTVVQFVSERGFAQSKFTMVGFGNNLENDNTPEDRIQDNSSGYLFQ